MIAAVAAAPSGRSSTSKKYSPMGLLPLTLTLTPTLTLTRRRSTTRARPTCGYHSCAPNVWLQKPNPITLTLTLTLTQP